MKSIKYLPHGKHAFAEFINCPNELLFFDSRKTKKFIHLAIYKSNAEILEFSTHKFPNGSYSITVNLSESHFSIHTYPEYRAVFIDCFTCGMRCRPEKTLEFIKKKFGCSGKIRMETREIKI